MKIQTILKGITLGAAILTIAACSTKGGKGGAAGGMDGANGYGSGQGGTYTEGMGGSGSGYGGTENCNVPGGSTSSYFFEYDSNSLNSEDRARVQSVAQSIAGKNGRVEVVGNTDNRGSREYNVALGWRRADAVASALEQNGVSRQQINTNSNGAEKPISYGDSEQDYQCNRRVDVKE